ncbi:MAG: diguanylate cyclase, partial [Actinomycetota bacterium]|nr:diguanylate cyclase [Actinomycetota bacterium]
SKKKMDKEDCLPLSIIIADINGLRLINDAFGYSEGDWVITKTGKIIQSCCRKEDILARIGGDEFNILLPNTNSKKAYEIIHKIKNACEQYNLSIKNKAQSINLSMGYGTKQTKEESIQIAEKEAEEYMNKRKLLESKSYHHMILASIMATMYVRSHETENHAKRLAHMSKLIGEKINLSQRNLDDLQLLAMLHDIGKVGIDDKILNKPGKLTDEEWVIMKKHSEFGYRIATSSQEFAHIAKYILSHHEHWDGTGYPSGLIKEEIPLLSRIIAVVDAYDAMTKKRVYRKALTKKAAIEEITKNAGTQFDPEIVKVFIEIIK